MAIPKVMGIETEYGITVRNQADFNPILSSLLLINSYETYRTARIRWDYEAESPLRDARGFEYADEKELPSKEESRLINLILPNGARFYVDHAHPEYSTPECTNPRDLVIWDRAGERILDLARRRAEAASPPEQRILIYKNNTDSKGNSYGTHENYLMDRRCPFTRIVQFMMPFLVTRQIFTGAGKVGSENNLEYTEYQVSQRADFLETEVGLETMHSRPIINTRDEPHADPEKYRRLHVIVGDANMSEVANYLKVGTTAVVLSMIEDDFIDRDFSLDNPVQSLPPGLARPRLPRPAPDARRADRDGHRPPAGVPRARPPLLPGPGARPGDEGRPRALGARPRPARAGPDVAQPRARLGDQARSPRELPGQARLDWTDSRVAMIDLQYHDIRPGKGLYYKLEQSDAVERIASDDEIARAVNDPPRTPAPTSGACACSAIPRTSCRPRGTR